MSDVTNGFGAIFPAPLAVAASWDMALVEQAQTIAAREARAVAVFARSAWQATTVARSGRRYRQACRAGADLLFGAAGGKRASTIVLAGMGYLADALGDRSVI